MFTFPVKMFGKGVFVKEKDITEKKKLGVSTTNLHNVDSIDQSRGVEINLADMDKTFLEQ